MADCCEHGNEPSKYINCGQFLHEPRNYGPSSRLLDSQLSRNVGKSHSLLILEPCEFRTFPPFDTVKQRAACGQTPPNQLKTSNKQGWRELVYDESYFVQNSISGRWIRSVMKIQHSISMSSCNKAHLLCWVLWVKFICKNSFQISWISLLHITELAIQARCCRFLSRFCCTTSSSVCTKSGMLQRRKVACFNTINIDLHNIRLLGSGCITAVKRFFFHTTFFISTHIPWYYNSRDYANHSLLWSLTHNHLAVLPHG
jgi:hypothetical protein